MPGDAQGGAHNQVDHRGCYESPAFDRRVSLCGILQQFHERACGLLP